MSVADVDGETHQQVEIWSELEGGFLCDFISRLTKEMYSVICLAWILFSVSKLPLPELLKLISSKALVIALEDSYCALLASARYSGT